MYKKIFNKIQYLFILGVLFLPFGFANAKAGDPVKLENPLASGGIHTVKDLIDVLLEIMVAIGTPIAVLAIIYCGFLFVKAQGKPEDLKAAREIFMWTIVGVVILLGAQLLETVISETISDLGAGI